MSDKENKEVNVEEVSVDDTKGSSAPTTAIDNEDTLEELCDDQVSALMQEVRELNDKYLRTAAELENTRRRATIDAESAARRRAMTIAGYFLPVMDAVDVALSHSPDDEGLLSLQRAIAAAFTQIGIVKIDAVGQPLNPQFHNAIQVVPASDGTTPNTIIEQMQPGYMFGDTVLRTAMVVVAK